MIYLYSSNRLEILAEILAEQVAGKENRSHGFGDSVSVFTPDTVVVQSQGMERWVKLEIAKHNGICANLHCPFPKAFLMDCLEKSVGVPHRNLFSRDALVWRIYALLGDDDFLCAPEFKPLSLYIGEGRRDLKRYQLAEKLGTLFDQYLTFRPATILSWSGYEREKIPFSDPILFQGLDDQSPDSQIPDSQNLDFQKTDSNSETVLRNEYETTEPFSPSPFMERGVGGEVRGQKFLKDDASGNRFSPIETHGPWQRLLWKKLYETAPDGTLLNRLAQFLFSDISQYQSILPKSVHLFGMSSIPLQFMLFFEKYSQIADVHLYYLSPCKEFWEDCVKERTKLALDLKSMGTANRSEDDLYWEVGNPLLSSMGISARDFSRSITGIDGAVVEVETFTPSPTRGLLHRIQNDILFLKDPTSKNDDSMELPMDDSIDDPIDFSVVDLRDAPMAGIVNEMDLMSLENETSLEENGGGIDIETNHELCPHSGVDDGSVAIHICHSRMREVEVLFDQLLKMMADDTTLHPRDILVLTPDIASCAPYIKAVFDTPETPDMKIPYSIADRMPGQENPVASAFLNLFTLHRSRFTAVDIMEILRVEAVYTRFGLDEQGLQLIQRWIHESGIRWGADAAFKESLGLPGRHENSWRFGFDRMLMGYAALQDQGLVHSVLPLDIEGNDAEIAGRFMGFFDALSHLAEAVERLDRGSDGGGENESIIDQWESLFMGALTAFFDETPETEGDLHEVRSTVTRLFETLRESEVTEGLGLDALLSYLKEKLADDAGGRGFLHGGVTFCRFRPMRSIPARVICLIGMDDGAYPRQAKKAGFDLMAAAPLPGDTMGRTEERYLFLEALLSARERLYISYVGRSIKDNSPLPPSILVAELISYIGEKSQQLIITHPLQPFSHRYFDGSDPKLFSYASDFCQGAAALQKGVDDHATDGGGESEKIEITLPEAVSLENLLRFFSNPAKYYLRDMLSITLPEREESALPEVDEPFEWEERSYFRDSALVDEMVATSMLFDGDGLYEIYRAAGAMPMGVMERCRFDRYVHDLTEFAQTVLAHQGTLRHRPCPLSISLTGAVNYPGHGNGADDGNIPEKGRHPLPQEIEGTVSRYYPDFGLINYRYAETAHRLYLQTWIEGLLLVCAGIPCDNLLMIRRGKKSGKSTASPAVERLSLPDPAACRDYLGQLIALYIEGCRKRVPFFPKSSFACAKASFACKEGQDPFEKGIAAAKEKWTPQTGYHGTGESSDLYFNEAFGEAWFETASPDQLNRFFDLAEAVYHPLLHGIRVSS